MFPWVVSSSFLPQPRQMTSRPSKQLQQSTTSATEKQRKHFKSKIRTFPSPHTSIDLEEFCDILLSPRSLQLQFPHCTLINPLRTIANLSHNNGATIFAHRHIPTKRHGRRHGPETPRQRRQQQRRTPRFPRRRRRLFLPPPLTLTLPPWLARPRRRSQPS